MANPRTIIKGAPIQKEGVASATISPGMLVERHGAGLLRPHTADGDPAVPAFARERDITGDGQDVDYAADDSVLYVVCRTGDEVQAILAEGNNVTAQGVLLASAGAGKLKIAGNTDAVIASSMEVVNATSEDKRIIVEIVTGTRQST